MTTPTLAERIDETRRRYELKRTLYGARAAERLRVKLTTLLLKRADAK
jgi:hypothetical protein